MLFLILFTFDIYNVFLSIWRCWMRLRIRLWTSFWNTFQKWKFPKLMEGRRITPSITQCDSLFGHYHFHRNLSLSHLIHTYNFSPSHTLFFMTRFKKSKVQSHFTYGRLQLENIDMSGILIPKTNVDVKLNLVPGKVGLLSHYSICNMQISRSSGRSFCFRHRISAWIFGRWT